KSAGTKRKAPKRGEYPGRSHPCQRRRARRAGSLGCRTDATSSKGGGVGGSTGRGPVSAERRFPEALAIPPRGPLDATVRVPGSKSLTNRAALCAALAAGESTLEGALESD